MPLETLDEKRIFRRTNKYEWDEYYRVAVKKGRYGPFLSLSIISTPKDKTKTGEREFGPFFAVSEPDKAQELGQAIIEVIDNNRVEFEEGGATESSGELKGGRKVVGKDEPAEKT